MEKPHFIFISLLVPGVSLMKFFPEERKSQIKYQTGFPASTFDAVSDADVTVGTS